MKRQAAKPARDGRQAAAAALAAAGGARGGDPDAQPADGGRAMQRPSSYQRPSAAKHKPRQAPAHTPDRCGRVGRWGV